MTEKSGFRKSVFVVTYCREGNRIKYLLLKRKKHWKGWEFTKEGIEKGETDEDAVKRGVREETGLNIKGEIKRFDVHGKYRYKKKYSDRPGFTGQAYSLYAAEINCGKVKLDSYEHSAYEWLDFENALKKLTWRNQKESLKIVNSSLENRNFRKIITKNRILILAGKDENTNEELIKQVSPDEYVFHTAAAGSPFVNIKGKADSGSMKEAAIFCAKYSRDWKKNKKDVKVHRFSGRDIYKNKGMKTGTFGVKKFDVVRVKKEEIEKFAPSGN
jgi:bis(5'-nucleosidyl)-tetraphosphatase